MGILRYLPLWLEQQLSRRQSETFSQIRTYRMFCLSRKYSMQADSAANNPATDDQQQTRSPSCEADDASSRTPSSNPIDIDLINHLERTSLVDFGNEEAFRRLQEAIKFADTLLEVDTTGVQPMTSVLENESLYLREDKACPTKREDILANASVTEEDYFVAPPGNIPLEPQKKKF